VGVGIVVSENAYRESGKEGVSFSDWKRVW